jgi:succinate dehydrogenase / fumarate reductase, membrane anchor subunit
MAFATPPAGIGTRRLVVGAHYGVGNFLLQRLTALVLVFFFALLGVRLLLAGSLDYVAWASIFVPMWMKVLTLVALLALLYHAWIGMKDIWLDYLKPVWVRLTLQALTVLWLVACAVWSVQILWRV